MSINCRVSWALTASLLFSPFQQNTDRDSVFIIISLEVYASKLISYMFIHAYSVPLLWFRMIGPCLKESIAAAAASTSLSISVSALSLILLDASLLDRYGKRTGSGRRVFMHFLGTFSDEDKFWVVGGGKGARDNAWIRFGRYCASTIHNDPFPKF